MVSLEVQYKDKGVDYSQLQRKLKNNQQANQPIYILPKPIAFNIKIFLFLFLLKKKITY